MLPPAEARAALDAHSLATIGYQDYARQLSSAYGDALAPGVVLVAGGAKALQLWLGFLRRSHILATRELRGEFD